MTLLVAIVCSLSTFKCGDDADCEYLGSCTAGKCACTPGFKGDSCGEIDFLPAPSDTRGILWPQPAQLSDNSTFSWGFTVVYDEAQKTYEAVVNVGCCSPEPANPRGTCGVTVGGTYLVHLRSTEPDRGYTAQGAFMVPTSFNPHLMRARNGTYVLYFRVNDMQEYRVCRGDGVSLPNSSDLVTYIDRGQVRHTDPSGEGPGANMYAAWAPSMAGPWQVHGPLQIRGMESLHISNPSATFLSDGRTLLAFRYNPVGGEANGIAVADSFLGPFTAVANITKGPHRGNDEDPFLWQDANGACHILYHNGPLGYHDFTSGPDCAATKWRKSPLDAPAYSLDVRFTDGATYSLHRRERPQLLFRENNVTAGPTWLFNGVNSQGAALPGEPQRITGGGFSRAFSLVQPIAAGRRREQTQTHTSGSGGTATGHGGLTTV